MEEKKYYKSLPERITIDNEMTTKGFRMIHDDFDENSTTSGTMTYTDEPEVVSPIIPSRNLAAEIDELKARLDTLEAKSA